MRGYFTKESRQGFCILVFSIAFASTTLTWLTSCAHKAEKKEQAQLHLQLGTSLLESGQYPEALRALSEAHHLDPENPAILNNLALAYFYRGKPRSAVVYLERALALNSKDTEAMNNLGRILLELRQFDRAESLLKQATEDLMYSYPEKPHFNLGMLYLEKKDFSKSVQHLKQALHYKKDMPQAWLLLSRAYMAQRNFKAAAESADMAAARLNYEDVHEALYLAGFNYQKAGHKDQAKQRLSELIRLYPQSPYKSEAQRLLQSMEARSSPDVFIR
ncbi:MAG: tetratricopeptide repeat protein [Bdellovibrionaceae bacterium]|jgi:type IV pilus biogenesis/stability protein PilW|nr:tetratricopeptide repeat protein [Pseudobdellovibrionaceae bacterium]